MSVYNELRTRIWRSYQDLGNGFHPEDAARKIAEAFQSFQQPFEQVGGQIDRQRAGLYPSAEQFKNDALNTQRIIDADLEVLRSAIAAAARADNVKISRTIVDQSVAVRKAKTQQQADREMLSQMEKLSGQIREDIKVASERTPSGGPPTGELAAVDIDLLIKSISERASPKEDAIAAEQLGMIGGQDEPL
jgi:hypothetical protein